MTHAETPEEAQLWNLIAAREVEGADVAAIDAEIERRFGTRQAILFTDLTGFSRQVAEFGILHFLGVIRRKRLRLLPIVEAHHGTLIKLEADSFLVVFDEPMEALQCALAMRRATWEINRTLPPESQLLLCMGLGYGDVIRVGDADVWGRAVNAASKLGEDTARTDEILVTGDFKRAVAGPDDTRFVRIDGVAAAPDAWEWVPRT